MQRSFFETDPLKGRLHDLVSRCNTLTAWAREHDVPVVVVRTQHARDRSTWTISMQEDDAGFLLEGDDDAQFLTELDVEGATELVKTRDSAFHETDLRSRLRRLGVNQLVITGVSTHTCVGTTAADAYANDLDVVLVDDAIASHREELHEVTLAVLCEEFRFRRRTTAQLLSDGFVPLSTRLPDA